MFRLRTLGLALAVVASLILVRVVPSILLRSRLTEAFVEAAGNGDTATVQALLAQSVPVDGRDRHPLFGRTALMLAAIGGHASTAMLLLAHGADVRARDNEGRTPLMLAADRGETAAVDALLAHGAEVNAQNRKGETALMRAERAGHIAIVQLLRKAGAKE
jgi:ankyrin repeat protein